MLSAVEGMVEVCVSLSAMSDTERDFTVTLITNSDTGSYQSHVGISVANTSL